MEWKRRVMPFTTYRRIMEGLLRLGGLEQIILSGMGDPSLNDELPDMVLFAHRHGIGVTIITNLLAVDLPAILASDGELNLLVSVCGVTEPVWNAFHGGSLGGGFSRLLDQLRVLREWEFLPKHVQVINAENYHELVDMVYFAAKWPAKRVNFKFASLGNGTEAVALSAEQRRELLEQYIPRAEAVAQFKGIDTDLAAFRTQVSLTTLRTAPIEEVGCYMGTIYCRITVDCELLYCCNTAISVGFLEEGVEFEQLWYGDKYAELRERLSRRDFFESCQQCGKYKQNLKWASKLNELARAGKLPSGAASVPKVTE
jgi:MoaA/NifB/PqqE/SkfB family radical SAM enzyme